MFVIAWNDKANPPERAVSWSGMCFSSGCVEVLQQELFQQDSIEVHHVWKSKNVFSRTTALVLCVSCFEAKRAFGKVHRNWDLFQVQWESPSSNPSCSLCGGSKIKVNWWFSIGGWFWLWRYGPATDWGPAQGVPAFHPANDPKRDSMGSNDRWIIVTNVWGFFFNEISVLRNFSEVRELITKAVHHLISLFILGFMLK